MGAALAVSKNGRDGYPIAYWGSAVLVAPYDIV